MRRPGPGVAARAPATERGVGLRRLAPRIALLCLLGIGASSGCVHTASLDAWRPAAMEHPGLRRVVVAPFAGEHGDAARELLETRLARCAFHEVVALDELRPIQVASATSRPHEEDWLGRARSAGVDGLLTGEVLEFTCVDEPQWAFSGAAFGNRGGPRGGSGVGVGVDVSKQRRAVLVLKITLIDVGAGQPVLEKTFERRVTSRDPRGIDLSGSSEDVLSRLLDDCFEEASRALAPAQVALNFQLACGDVFAPGARKNRQGMAAAAHGDWSTAEQQWLEALVINPDDDAVQYNLALAAAAREDFARAEQLAMQALKTRHAKLYVDGLEQIRKVRTDFERSLEQRERLRPLEHSW